MEPDRPVKPLRRITRPHPQKPPETETTEGEECAPRRTKNQDEAKIVSFVLALLGSLNVILAALAGFAAFHAERIELFGISVGLLESGFLMLGFSLILTRLHSR